MPDELMDQLISSWHFMTGSFLLRQMIFGLFDMNLHEITPSNFNEVHNEIVKVRDKYEVFKPWPKNRFENSFSHIFAGGYSAGYYSYVWAEILSSDCFCSFR